MLQDVTEGSDGLHFANGYGGFSEDGKEYIIELQEGMNTPCHGSTSLLIPNSVSKYLKWVLVIHGLKTAGNIS